MEEAKQKTEQTEQAQQTDWQQPRQLRGLYGKVKISVRTLNIIIVVLIILLIGCMAFGIAKGGFRVSFDSQGGTAVEMQVRMHGELIEMPELPTREGFVFDGWYLDPGCTMPWNLETDTVTESMTLYAGWIEN